MALEQADIDRLKDIFVLKDKCEADMGSMKDKLSSDNARLAVIEHQLGTVTKLLYGVLAGVGTLILGSLWRLIAK